MDTSFVRVGPADLPLRPAPLGPAGGPWAWRLADGRDLADLLARHGAAPPAARIPLLAPPSEASAAIVLRVHGGPGLWLATPEQARLLAPDGVARLGAGVVTDERGVDLAGAFVPAPAGCRADAADWPDALFVYGTLCPGASAWDLLAPHTVGAGRPTRLSGALYDTGLGYPALCPAAEGAGVPGWTVRLRTPAASLPALDDYEGADYARVRVVDSAGTVCWTYRWTGPVADLRPLPEGWAAARHGQSAAADWGHGRTDHVDRVQPGRHAGRPHLAAPGPVVARDPRP